MSDGYGSFEVLNSSACAIETCKYSSNMKSHDVSN